MEASGVLVWYEWRSAAPAWYKPVYTPLVWYSPDCRCHDPPVTRPPVTQVPFPTPSTPSTPRLAPSKAHRIFRFSKPYPAERATTPGPVQRICRRHDGPQFYDYRTVSESNNFATIFAYFRIHKA